MWAGIFARVWQAGLTVLVASIFSFLLVPLSPGSPAVALLQSQLNRTPTAAEITAKEAALGLDRPWLVQYGQWLGRLTRGDLGQSWRTGQPVALLLRDRIWPTLLLGGTAFVLGLTATVALALLGAAWQGRWPDWLVRATMLGLGAVPPFVLGLLAVHGVAVGLGLSRVITDGTVATVWLPALVLGLAGVNGRPLRALLVVQMQAEPARALRARGASGRFILLRFALPNAMVAYLGMIGLSVGAIIGGDVIVESVFSWPGLGGLAVTAVMQRDMPLVQSYVVLTTLAYVLASMLCDLAADLADPRRTDLGRF